MTAIDIDIREKAFPRPLDQSPLVTLANLRFIVAEGEFACIVGPSGCGKTTLLNLISGLDPAVNGTITMGPRSPARAAGIGYMFQSPRLMPWLTVRDNVALVLGDGADNRPVDELLGEMGLGEFMDAYPSRLSGGMQRRVALARAFATEPGLLLLDEPFLSLDTPVANRLRGLLLDLRSNRPTTILFVTHDLREALYLADRVLFMSPRPGRIVLDLPVDLPRSREPEGEEIESLRLRLLREHPQLLAGLAGAGNSEPQPDPASSRADQAD